MHLNPAWREAEGRCQEGRGGAARPRQPIRAGGSLPSPAGVHAPKFQIRSRATTRRLPPPSSASRNYLRKRSQRFLLTVRSVLPHYPCGLSSNLAQSPSLYRCGESFEPADVEWPRGRNRRRRDSECARCGHPRAACGARIRSAEAPERLFPSIGSVSRRGRSAEEGEKMVVLRSSLELHSHPAASATDSLDLSNEFLSLEQIGRRRLRSAGAAEQSAVTAAAAGVSTGLGQAPRSGLGDCLPGARSGLGDCLPGARWSLGVGWAVLVTVGAGREEACWEECCRGQVKWKAFQDRSPRRCGVGEEMGQIAGGLSRWLLPTFTPEETRAPQRPSALGGQPLSWGLPRPQLTHLPNQSPRLRL